MSQSRFTPFSWASKATTIPIVRRLIRVLLGLIMKSAPGGGVAASEFALSGGVMKATVVFATPYTGATADFYNVLLTPYTSGGCGFAPRFESRTATGFVINLGTKDKTGLIAMSYTAIKQD